MALGWAGLSEVSVRESGPGAHFAEFQVGIEGVLPDFALKTIIALIDMAKPLRTHLKRVYNDLEDHRYLIFWMKTTAAISCVAIQGSLCL